MGHGVSTAFLSRLSIYGHVRNQKHATHGLISKHSAAMDLISAIARASACYPKLVNTVRSNIMLRKLID